MDDLRRRMDRLDSIVSGLEIRYGRAGRPSKLEVSLTSPRALAVADISRNPDMPYGKNGASGEREMHEIAPRLAHVQARIRNLKV